MLRRTRGKVAGGRKNKERNEGKVERCKGGRRMGKARNRRGID